MELLETNGGCELPCWWGLRPGRTDWATANNFLNTFAQEIRTTAQGAGVFFQFPSINRGDLFVQGYTIENGIIQTIHPQIVTGDYGLPEMLGDYGIPTEVRIRTFSATSEGSLPFRVVLIYAEKGILISYEARGELDGAVLRGCPQRGTTRPQLWLWLPNDDQHVPNDIRQEAYGRGEEEFYLELEQATDMTLSEFYQVFMDPLTSTCIETPAEIW